MEGHIGSVNKTRAIDQWNALKQAYEQIGLEVVVLDGQPGLPDMVFCANQSLPYRTPGGDQGVVLSRMHAEQRKKEVPFYESFFEEQGYEISHLDSNISCDFEGMGDALWHPGRYLLWGGFGYRTEKEIYESLSDDLGIPAITLHLTDPDFYHLDTCLCPLNENTVLIYAGAFQPDGLDAIRSHFTTVLEAPEREARELFACNAHCPDGQHVIIQKGCTETNQMLLDAGFDVIQVETDEFLKSGGSVFCMKLMFW